MANTTPLLDVALPGPRGRLLSYAAPDGVEPAELLGHRVQVRVGNKPVVGVVVGSRIAEPPPGLRPVEDLLDPPASPAVPKELLDLTRWIAEYYFCDWLEALRAALPGGLLRPPELLLRWTGPELEGQWPGPVQESRELLRLARGLAGQGRIDLSALKKKLGRTGLLAPLRSLEQLGLVELAPRHDVDPETTSTIELVRLLPTAEGVDPGERASARKRLLDTLRSAGGIMPWPALRRAAQVERSTLTWSEEMGYTELRRIAEASTTAGFDPRAEAAGQAPPPLSEDQASAVEQLSTALGEGEYASFLLTGLPGSGKTRVYIEALRRSLEQGRGALLLVPEIGLTPQVVARIRAALDEPAVVLHSGLTAAQRVAAWREVLEGRVRVVVGPRSAVFAPVANLGLVVVDEEHEESYKQADPAPRYHARDVALLRAQRAGATALLVSATPSLEAVQLVERGAARRLNLRSRFGAGWPKLTLADRRGTGGSHFIGGELAEAIGRRERDGEGVVLLVTRRGYAPTLACAQCGHRSICPDCDIALTYHRSGRLRLRCHLCGHSEAVPDRCPACTAPALTPVGVGTQRLADEVAARFPALSALRMDSDTTRRDGEHERILRDFARGDAGLLLGTQVVAKGHDFEHVTLVGVVNADPALFQPDFRAEERTFRLLVQAAGRAGRGERPGEMVVQTLDPNHTVFQHLAEPDIGGFLSEQASRRRALGYPPFVRLALLTIAADDAEQARHEAERHAKALAACSELLRLRGPAEAAVARVKRRFRQRILLSTPREEDPAGRELRRALRHVLGELEVDRKVSRIVDVDPVEVA